MNHINRAPALQRTVRGPVAHVRTVVGTFSPQRQPLSADLALLTEGMDQVRADHTADLHDLAFSHTVELWLIPDRDPSQQASLSAQSFQLATKLSATITENHSPPRDLVHQQQRTKTLPGLILITHGIHIHKPRRLVNHHQGPASTSLRLRAHIEHVAKNFVEGSQLLDPVQVAFLSRAFEPDVLHPSQNARVAPSIIRDVTTQNVVSVVPFRTHQTLTRLM